MRRKSRSMGVTDKCSVIDVSFGKYIDHWCTHHAAYVMGCLQCGREFHSARPHTKTCSNACRQKMYRERNQEVQTA